MSASQKLPYPQLGLIGSNTTRTYNFGFIGTKAIAITPNEAAENTKAVFTGNNSGYTPDDPATISVAEVIFGANNSLFQFTKTYGHGTFSAATGNETLLNTIPEGTMVTFTGGFTLGKGHTLIVRGTLIG